MRTLILVFLVGCMTEPPVDETQQEAICNTCGDGGGGGTVPACSSTCDSQASCSTTCADAGGATTCGGYGVCRSCASFCTDSVACQETCKTASGTISSCGTVGSCRKFDVYCAYPVITDNGVSDIHESVLTGPTAYMYFGSAGISEKTGTYPSHIGGNTYDPNAAWASNFRGAAPVTGETARTQWEFRSDLLHADWGSTGTPYRYGQQCLAVPAGTTPPTLTSKTESIYEDDECRFGICNPDDYVGAFTIDRAHCASDVFLRGQLTGWSSRYGATVSGDVTQVNYKMWCYSCKNAQSATCSTGVQN